MEKEKNLLELLSENKEWPLKYMFKFVVKNEDKLIEEVKKQLPINGTVSYKESKGSKYVSITCIADMPSAQSIVAITEKIGSMDGIISL